MGFLVFVELTSGFLQGYYLPLFGEIARRLDVSDADITWFNTLQTLAAGVCVPVLAKLGDIVGHRRILRLAIITVLVGSVLVALSPDLPLVLVGRVLTGPLAVWLPLEVALVHSRITGEPARRAIGLLVSALTIGAVLGTLVSGAADGLLPDLTLVLLVPSVILALCTVIVFTLIPESTVRTRPHIDVVGFAGLALAMVALLWGLRTAQSSGFGAPMAWGSLVVAALAVAGFVSWELRTEAPAVDIRLVTSRRLWPAYATAFLFGMVLFGTQTITTTFLAADPDTAGYGFAFTPGVISLFTAATALLGAVGASCFAFLARPLGLRGVILAGVLAGSLGNVLLAVGSATLGLVVAAIVISGLGYGLLLGGLPSLVAESSPADQTGIATGVYNSLRTLGGSAAGAVFGVVLAGFTASGAGASSLGGYRTVWVICAAAFASCCLLLRFLHVDERREPDAVAPTRSTQPDPEVTH